MRRPHPLLPLGASWTLTMHKQSCSAMNAWSSHPLPLPLSSEIAKGLNLWGGEVGEEEEEEGEGGLPEVGSVWTWRRNGGTLPGTSGGTFPGTSGGIFPGNSGGTLSGTTSGGILTGNSAWRSGGCRSGPLPPPPPCHRQTSTPTQSQRSLFERMGGVMTCSDGRMRRKMISSPRRRRRRRRRREEGAGEVGVEGCGWRKSWLCWACLCTSICGGDWPRPLLLPLLWGTAELGGWPLGC